MKIDFKKKSELESLDIKNLIDEKKKHEEHISKFQTYIDNYDKSLLSFKKDLKEFVILYKKYYSFAENNSKFVDDVKSESSFVIFSKTTDVKKLTMSNSAKAEFLRLYKEFISFGDKMFENIWCYVRNKMPREYEPTWILLTSKKYNKEKPEMEFAVDTSDLVNLSTDYLDSLSDEAKALSTFSFPFDIFMHHSKLESKTFHWFFDFRTDHVQVQRFMDPWGLKIFSKNDLINSLNQIKDELEPYFRKIELLLRSKQKGKEKIENIGYVYVMFNESLPKNTYKIGSTYGNPDERAEQLTGTGHLTPFIVVNKIKIQSAEYYEKLIHKLLNKYRVKKGKEMFELDLNKIKQCLKQVSEISEKGTKKITLAKIQKEINLNK